MRITASYTAVIFLCLAVPALAQLGGSGTVQGTVKDPTGGVMVSVIVDLSNAVSGFKRSAATDAAGQFAFRNLPPNLYHLEINAQGFAPMARDVDVRSAVPIDVPITLALAGQTTSVDVVGTGELVERDPTAHTDIDQSLMQMLTIEGSLGLNQVITLASPGVVADANGFFHPVGDHAQTQFSIDNQPVTDQQSRLYSNQISPNAVQSMELITGVPPAEFGDKDSLVVRIVTKSGLDASRPTGSMTAGYGSFKMPKGDINLGVGSHSIGNFLSYSGMRTARYLDPPEFDALHDTGNSNSFFDRIDAGAFHLNTQVARSSFNVPNTIDQDSSGQAQHQTIDSFNIAPGFTKATTSNWLFAANGYVRRDHLVYTPSANPLADTPATVSQNRKLTNYGGKVDVSYVGGSHNVKMGGSVSATKLTENFTFGVTDPTFNAACLDNMGNPVPGLAIVDPSNCAAARLVANDAFIPELAPFDLTRRGGTLFNFADAGTIKSQAAYVQDSITAGPMTLNLGVRVDHYDGRSKKTEAEPRVGVAFATTGSGTVVRASYGRTMETPYNENLLLSSSDVFGGGGQALPPGVRDQFEGGIQQALGRWVVADFGYFYKKTKNAYDFGVLFNTPIAFPISWDHSKLDGFTGRINLLNHGGFSAFTVMAHTNAIFSKPQTGGLFPDTSIGSFRIDHDQKFNQTTNAQYEYAKAIGAWIAVTWRYDSGLVAGSVPDIASALALTGDQQAAIGLSCGGVAATVDVPIAACSRASFSVKRLRIPAQGTEDPVTNPPRIAPRHLFDLGLGVDNVFQSTKTKVKVRFSVVNLTNKEALYNFLSTFSGTHFVTPRAYQVEAGITF
jgi:carboxypeptidase family protein